MNNLKGSVVIANTLADYIKELYVNTHTIKQLMIIDRHALAQYGAREELYQGSTETIKVSSTSSRPTAGVSVCLRYAYNVVKFGVVI